MVKADLLIRAMEAARLEGAVAGKAVEALFESLCAALERGDPVVLRRFGLFHVAGWCASAPRCVSAVSPAAAEAAARRRPDFKPSRRDHSRRRRG